MESNAAWGAVGDAGRFATTRWHLILPGEEPQSDDGTASGGFTHLAQAYWRPIFAVIFRRGYSAVDAQDLTQDFFIAVAKGKLLQVAHPSRGRFRCLLLRALQNFLNDYDDKRDTHKRGGRIEFLPWDRWMDQDSSGLEIPPAAVESWPDDRLFDAGWAASLAGEALRKLRVEYESRGRRAVFDALSPHLAAERSHISYQAMAERLGIAQTTVKRLLHDMRVYYRRHLRAEVAATVTTVSDIDDEIRYLCRALCAAESLTP